MHEAYVPALADGLGMSWAGCYGGPHSVRAEGRGEYQRCLPPGRATSPGGTTT
jgi:hypothetical protein